MSSTNILEALGPYVGGRLCVCVDPAMGRKEIPDRFCPIAGQLTFHCLFIG